MLSGLLWKSRTRRVRTGKHRPRSGMRPLVETLEDRLAPAVFNVTTTADILTANREHDYLCARAEFVISKAVDSPL